MTAVGHLVGLMDQRKRAEEDYIKSLSKWQSSMQKKLKSLKGNKIHNSYKNEKFLLFELGHPEGILKEFKKKYNDHFEIQSKY